MTKVCEICGKEFAVTNKNQSKKICSLACRIQKHRMATRRSNIGVALKELRLEAHGNRISSHYANAKEKHPYFCDEITGYNSHVASSRLKQMRDLIDWRKAYKCVTAEMLLRCELLEAEDAYIRGDKAQAVEELYDCVAVCLRTIDVLEGRQQLGRPQTISGNEAEK